MSYRRRNPTWWVRHNGQAELRDNIRTAIADRGLRRADVAEAVGLSYGQVSVRLSDDYAACWITRSEAQAFADFFDMDLDDLVGESMFKEDHARRPDFDYDPRTGPTTVADDDDVLREEGRTRAICCDCGSLRLVTAPLVSHDPQWGEGVQRCDTDPTGILGHRLTKRQHCSICGVETTHAILRLDPHRNEAEATDRLPTLADEARDEVRSLVERLAGFNVDVTFRQMPTKRRRKGYLAHYEYDEAKSRWLIEVDPNAPSRVQLEMVRAIWNDIATDHYDGIDWDPRDGVTLGASDRDWDAATDELLSDIQSRIVIERRRLVAHLRDQHQTNNEVTR